MEKIVLITGATSGIGKETALELIKLGWNVNILVRNQSKAEEFVKEIKAKYNKDIKFFIADLSSLESIRNVAKEINIELPHIDVLINNAGSIYDKYKESVDGIEMTIATNHFGPFLLTNLILKSISNKGRIINVSSAAHAVGHIDFDNLMSKTNFISFKAYSNSKLANILFTKKLAELVKDREITVNSLHPGIVRSGFGQNNFSLISFIIKLYQPFIISPKSGAKTSIYLATSSDVNEISGEYFDKCKVISSSKESNDKEVANKLWDLSLETVGL